MANKAKRESPLVQSVLALDHYLAELERVGGKINSTDMTSDFDVEHLQNLMDRFAECGQGVSKEVMNFSTHLNEARARAEAVTQRVAEQAELFNTRRIEQNQMLERFRVLGERVGELNAAIAQFRGSEDRAKLIASIPAVDAKCAGLIEELQDFRKAAKESHMRGLEKSAESLVQSLQAVRKKLSGLV